MQHWPRRTSRGYYLRIVETRAKRATRAATEVEDTQVDTQKRPHYADCALDECLREHVAIDAPPYEAIVENIEPGTPEWDESEIALERQRKAGG